jgi:hypothetical protein
LSQLTTEEDSIWTEEREPMPTLIARANSFLRYLKQRPERAIAVVTHNDFLKALFFESELVFGEESLRKTFGNAECVTIALAWDKAEGCDDGTASPAGGSTGGQ